VTRDAADNMATITDANSSTTQAEAINSARTIIGNDGGGELIVQSEQHLIRQKDTIAPGKDPFPPKG
jgi:Uncharacterized protein conserved in bacteria (DUF2188)